MVESKNRVLSHWWWLDSHSKTNPNRSPWLQSTLAELDDKTRAMLKVIEEDADSFAQRAEMYYKKRPELIDMVQDFYRAHRLLAERYDQVKSESGIRLLSPWSSPVSFSKYQLDRTSSIEKSEDSFASFSKYQLEKTSWMEKSYDIYSETCGPEELYESEVDDPEEIESSDEIHGEIEADKAPRETTSDEVTKLKEEIERLREENKIQLEQLIQKDEEKREVIRQLSLAMDLLKEENMELRKSVTKSTQPKPERYTEFNKLKEGFMMKLFKGFPKSEA